MIAFSDNDVGAMLTFPENHGRCMFEWSVFQPLDVIKKQYCGISRWDSE